MSFNYSSVSIYINYRRMVAHPFISFRSDSIAAARCDLMTRRWLVERGKLTRLHSTIESSQHLHPSHNFHFLKLEVKSAAAYVEDVRLSFLCERELLTVVRLKITNESLVVSYTANGTQLSSTATGFGSL